MSVLKVARKTFGLHMNVCGEVTSEPGSSSRQQTRNTRISSSGDRQLGIPGNDAGLGAGLVWMGASPPLLVRGGS